MTFFAEIRLGAAYKALNERFSLIFTDFRFFQIFRSCHWFLKISKKITNLHFSLGSAIFVHFCSEKSMMKLNVTFFKSEKLYYVMYTHLAHRVHQAHIRHIFDEISMTGENDCLDSIWRPESAICRHECRNTRSFRTLWPAKSVSSKKMRDNSPTGSFTVTIPRSRIWRKNVKNMKNHDKNEFFRFEILLVSEV